MVILYLESLQTLMYNCHTLNDQWEFTMNLAKYILDREFILACNFYLNLYCLTLLVFHTFLLLHVICIPFEKTPLHNDSFLSHCLFDDKVICFLASWLSMDDTVHTHARCLLQQFSVCHKKRTSSNMNDLYPFNSCKCALHFDRLVCAVKDAVISNRLRPHTGFLH